MLNMVGASCAHFPEPRYVTSHGFNIFCESDKVCYSQKTVEDATNFLIDELEHQLPELYSREDIDMHLNAQYQWHSINFVDIKEGPPGSCATEGDPLRACRGFPCEASSSGWCAGLASYKRDSNGFLLTTMTVAQFYDCVSMNALTHELIHFFHRLILNKSDREHAWEPYWLDACTEEKYPDSAERTSCMVHSINRESNWKLCEKHCGDLCLGE